ncbi:MAG: hypothetical protein QXL82_02110 [Candidatus Aenigmatarchaeota archaeon]
MCFEELNYIDLEFTKHPIKEVKEIFGSSSKESRNTSKLNEYNVAYLNYGRLFLEGFKNV